MKTYSAPGEIRHESKGSHFKVLLLLLFLAAVAGAVYIWKFSLETKAESLREAIAFIQSEYQFAEIDIESKADETMSFTLSFMDLGGNAVARETFEIEGNDIFLESRVVLAMWDEGEKAFIFPFRIYSDKIPAQEGIVLTNFYVENSIPLTYALSSLNAGMKLSMKNIYLTAFGKEIFEKELKDEYIVNIFDTAVHQSVLNPFKKGKSYSYIVHPNGGVELIESGD